MAQGEFVVRKGIPGDAHTIARIYNYYISNSIATFDVDPVTTQDRMEWMGQFTDTGPYQILVATSPVGELLGYACSVPYHSRAAYYTSVMTSVYLDSTATGMGIGSKLYIQLLGILEKHPDLHRAYALVSLPNDASLALHRKSGFREVGVLHEAGKKFGDFISVTILERPL
jgi:phosphinothricin acetyltransferase